MRALRWMVWLAVLSCGAPRTPVEVENPEPLEMISDAGVADADAGVAGADAGVADAGPPPSAFATRVVSTAFGDGAGFGQDRLPDVVLGPPVGLGPYQGSLDVVSLGKEGSIVLALDGLQLRDGPGVDLLVFENAFPGFPETGVVGVSDDGVTWREWPCEPENADAGFPHCAGVHAVLSNPTNGVSATDPAFAGGDGFDLAELGVARARYVRVRDSGKNRSYAPPSAGFDLDGIAVVNGAPADGG